MKRILASYFMLTRIERIAYAGLVAILLILVLVWQLMPYWVHPLKENAAENERMALAFNNYRKIHLAPAEPDLEANPSIPTGLFAFDPNTLDSIGFLKLGLSVRATKGLMNWRRHGKVFYKKEDLKPLYNLTAENYERIAPYIAITSVHSEHSYNHEFEKLPPLPATLDLNTIDSATIVRLNGIGPTLAHKIIDKRKALGGYLKHEQLLEVYKFNDSTFTMLKSRLVINPAAVKKINVNSATLEQLQSQPYIGEKYAKGIIQYRMALKHFDNLQQLRQVPLMNEEIYRKIAPYLVVD